MYVGLIARVILNILYNKTFDFNDLCPQFQVYLVIVSVSILVSDARLGFSSVWFVCVYRLDKLWVNCCFSGVLLWRSRSKQSVQAGERQGSSVPKVWTWNSGDQRSQHVQWVPSLPSTVTVLSNLSLWCLRLDVLFSIVQQLIKIKLG